MNKTQNIFLKVLFNITDKREKKKTDGIFKK